MKQISLSFLFFLVLALPGFAQAKPDASDPRTQEIQNLIAALDQAAIKKDEAVGKAILHDEFTFVNPGGFVLNKERFLKSILLGNNVYEEHQTEELSVRFFGDVASCRALLKFRVNINGQSRDIQARLTIVVVKEKGQWQIFTYHSSTLPPPRPPQQPTSPATPAQPTKPPNEL
ncbi:MAG TPA: nuclear transport factor 2 family protein [Blastocatellia bacterium]|nr:nuclear transport factor 2 family protein [Blastocatellia bacterium]